MPWGLKRFHESRQLHFLTFSCYRRRPNFASLLSRDLFVSALERVRQKYAMQVYGYVVMAGWPGLNILTALKGAPFKLRLGGAV